MSEIISQPSNNQNLSQTKDKKPGDCSAQQNPKPNLDKLKEGNLKPPPQKDDKIIPNQTLRESNAMSTGRNDPYVDDSPDALDFKRQQLIRVS